LFQNKTSGRNWNGIEEKIQDDVQDGRQKYENYPLLAITFF
jgi:hypothetical protein